MGIFPDRYGLAGSWTEHWEAVDPGLITPENRLGQILQEWIRWISVVDDGPQFCMSDRDSVKLFFFSLADSLTVENTLRIVHATLF